MIFVPNLNSAIVLIVVGIILYAVLPLLPPASKSIVIVISTIVVLLGVLDLVLSLIHA